MMPHDDIERYVLDRMSHVEKTAFEIRIKEDAAINEEVAFQRTIFKGIGEARKAALKNRLAQVPVSSSWFSNAISSGWAKAAAGIVVVSAASLIFYTEGHRDDLGDDNSSVFIDAPESQEEIVISIPDRLITEKADAANQDIATASTTIENYDIAREIVEDEFQEDNVDLEGTLQIVPVNPPELEFEGELETQDEENNTLLDISSVEAPINIDVIESEEERLYRYFDGTLTLKGDYNSIYYDLLELNLEEGRLYFIEIDGDYFALPVTESFRSLDLIVNKSLISTLDSLTALN